MNTSASIPPVKPSKLSNGILALPQSLADRNDCLEKRRYQNRIAQINHRSLARKRMHRFNASESAFLASPSSSTNPTDTIPRECDPIFAKTSGQTTDIELQLPAEPADVDNRIYSRHGDISSKHTYFDKPQWLLEPEASLPTPEQLHERITQSSIVEQPLCRDGNTVAGNTPLHQAALYGHFSTVKVFLDRGADQAVVNSQGRTALHMASEGGHVDLVRLLLDRGQYIDAKDLDGITPLFLAAGLGHEETVLLLLDGGADINVARF